MPGTMTDLTVAGKLAARALGRRLRSEIEPAPDREKFTHEMQALLDKALSAVLLNLLSKK